MLFAALDEVHQAFVHGRDANIMDWLADAVGILISSYIYYKNK
ncbi:MAG: VanZ family protein [Candidatus Methanoperedens sp.]|nr:VanZ family protein [Candidatus Methanoperedens sp.]